MESIYNNSDKSSNSNAGTYTREEIEQSYATVLQHYGELSLHFAKYEESETSFTKSIEVLEKLKGRLGNNANILKVVNLDIAVSLVNVAQLKRIHGKYSEAEKLLRRSIELYKENDIIYGPGLSDTGKNHL